MSGTIRDGVTGLPVARAEVSTIFGEYKTLSRPSGFYELRLAEKDARGQKTFQVRAEGYGIEDKRVGREDSWQWDVSLWPARSLKLLVVSEGQRPVAGAKAVVWVGEGSPGFRYYKVTGVDGRCTFAGLPAKHTARVFAFHSRLGRCIRDDILLSATDDDEWVTLELVRGPATVVASVRNDDDSPAVDAQVLLLEDPLERIPLRVLQQGRVVGARLRVFGNLRVARSDEEGRAVFHDTLEGQCFVQAVGADFAVNVLDVSRKMNISRSAIARVHSEPEREVTRCELVLRRPYTLRGHVTTSDGTALEGVQVTLLLENDDGAWILESRSAVSNQFGIYGFTGLDPRERYAVAVQVEDQYSIPLRRPQWKRWTKVSSPPSSEREDEKEEFRGGPTSHSSREIRPEDMMFFAEVPAYAETENAVADITVDLP